MLIYPITPRVFVYMLQITWLDATGTVIADGITKKTEDIEGTKRKTAISRLKLAAKKAHHNATLTCR